MRIHKIMIVDDDPTVREVLQINLAARGYLVFPMASGREALDLFAELMPDIVVLDVMMPDLDGWEVLKVMRDLFEEDSIKILMLTALNTDRDRMIGTSILKADEYITKPFDLADLLETIDQLIEER